MSQSMYNTNKNKRR